MSRGGRSARHRQVVRGVDLVLARPVAEIQSLACLLSRRFSDSTSVALFYRLLQLNHFFSAGLLLRRRRLSGEVGRIGEPGHIQKLTELAGLLTDLFVARLRQRGEEELLGGCRLIGQTLIEL